jgi:small-conductance mechanosensitive channel
LLFLAVNHGFFLIYLYYLRPEEVYMDFWEIELWGNLPQRWLLAFGVMILLYFSLILIRSIVTKRISRLVKQTRSEIDDVLVDLLSDTKNTFLLIVSIYFGLLLLVLPLTIVAFVSTLIKVALIVQIGIWMNHLITFLIARRVKRNLVTDAEDATVISTLGVVLKGIIWAVVLLLVLDNIPGVQVNTLIASLGITGIAVGLAVQNILGDLFASLSIALDKPFVIGDFINVGEFSGTVEHVGLKSTRVRSLSGEQLVFGNGDLLSSRIRNFKRMANRRVPFILSVTYQTPYETLARVPAILQEVIECADPEIVTFDRAHFKNYGDYAIHFEIVYLLATADFRQFMDIQQTINLEIFRRFAEEGIEFAFPTQSVFLENGHGNGPRPSPIQ